MVDFVVTCLNGYPYLRLIREGAVGLNQNLVKLGGLPNVASTIVDGALFQVMNV
ncbi:MAG: hypothetical protein NT027_11175 [Proteobacteria bacterium]|nr:hypothetical protein [Pseudomonadota bacterium]